MLLSRVQVPVFEAGGSRAGIRELYRSSPTGVVGMFLCVPITVVSLIVLAQFETTRPIAVLLSSDGKIPEARR